MRPRIIISCGDVNGVGLQCLAGALKANGVPAELALAIPQDLYSKAVGLYGLTDTLEIIPLQERAVIRPGIPSNDSSLVAIASLERSIELVRTKEYHALVTLPINKLALSRVGWDFAGQTEMVAARVGGTPLMVLCSGLLRVALATVHLPLEAVTKTLTVPLITQRIQALHSHLVNSVGITSPTIAVLAVDPHAGESGVIGTTDSSIVAPAIATARELGVNVDGPHPADGFFGFGAYHNYDGILAMYHDQGLIPLKLLAKGAGVNVTAGLPVIRTSPDHGTAYNLAPTGNADPQSTYSALILAVEMAQRGITNID